MLKYVRLGFYLLKIPNDFFCWGTVGSDCEPTLNGPFLTMGKHFSKKNPITLFQTPGLEALDVFLSECAPAIRPNVDREAVCWSNPYLDYLVTLLSNIFNAANWRTEKNRVLKCCEFDTPSIMQYRVKTGKRISLVNA